MSMPLSSPELVEKSNYFLNGLVTPECPGCARGVRMCYHTPCIGTVDDIEKIIDAGLAKHLMLDWFCGFPESYGPARRKDNPFTEDILYLCPAIKGCEGKQAKFGRTGVCNLLVNNQCSLHTKNLKPVQGRAACCKVERVYEDENGEHKDIDERIPILHTWNTQRGKDLIAKWKQAVGFTDEVEDMSPPDNFIDQLQLMMQVFESMDNMNSPKGKNGAPDYDPNEKLEKEIQVYEKPY